MKKALCTTIVLAAFALGFSVSTHAAGETSATTTARKSTAVKKAPVFARSSQVTVIIYSGRNPTDCPACHTPAALAIRKNTARMLPVGNVFLHEVVLDRKAGAFVGMPPHIRVLPSYEIRVGNAVQMIVTGANDQAVYAAVQAAIVKAGPPRSAPAVAPPR